VDFISLIYSPIVAASSRNNFSSEIVFSQGKRKPIRIKETIAVTPTMKMVLLFFLDFPLFCFSTMFTETTPELGPIFQRRTTQWRDVVCSLYHGKSSIRKVSTGYVWQH
jgi:hypothetical protein